MKREKFWVMLAVFAMFLAVNSAWAADYQALIAEGDSWYEQRSDLAKAKMAAEKYKEAIDVDPNQPEAYWKLARALYWVGQHSPQDQQIPIFEEGIAAAKKAIQLDPDSVPGHYWLGVSYGLYGQAKGIMKSLSLVDPIKKEMAEVIKRDPGYNMGGAYMVLGRMYFKVPGLFGGDKKKAEENLKKAIELGPNRWISHVNLAELYMDQKKYDQAKALLTQAIEGSCPQGQEPDCQDWKKDARELLKQLEEKMK